MPDHDEKVAVGEPGDMLGQAMKNLNRKNKNEKFKSCRRAR